ncbi:10312_t:CDS:2, partial [Gigaspora rosea]
CLCENDAYSISEQGPYIDIIRRFISLFHASSLRMMEFKRPHFGMIFDKEIESALNVYQPFTKYDICNCKRDDFFMEELKKLYKEIELLSRYDIEKIEIINSMYESFSIKHREDIRKAIINANIRLLNKNKGYLVEYEPYHKFMMRIRKQHKPKDIMEYICDCSISINHIKNLLHIYIRRVNIEKNRVDKLKLAKKLYDSTSANERCLLERSITKNVINLLEYRQKSFITDLPR